MVYWRRGGIIVMEYGNKIYSILVYICEKVSQKYQFSESLEMRG
jgi:hypothetical protein